ncbi:MAG: hypothetical protein M1827_004442 [Pycnora praestabilis]|nr:MAG: hypothetical protein M1827_004442 [Pycnora praestabilis]
MEHFDKADATSIQVATTVTEAMESSGTMRSILIVNPNTTKSMTDSWEPLLSREEHSDGSASINDIIDVQETTEACLPHMIPLLGYYDGFLVASWMDCGLIASLKDHTDRPVTDLLEACLIAARIWISMECKFYGTLTTSDEAFRGFVVDEARSCCRKEPSLMSFVRYVAVESIGLSATELHHTLFAETCQRIVEATKLIVTRDGTRIGVICLGSERLSHYADAVREACVDRLGQEKGDASFLISAIEAGVAQLYKVVHDEDIAGVAKILYEAEAGRRYLFKYYFLTGQRQ